MIHMRYNRLHRPYDLGVGNRTGIVAESTPFLAKGAYRSRSL
jgi:hypothetical protein